MAMMYNITRKDKDYTMAKMFKGLTVTLEDRKEWLEDQKANHGLVDYHYKSIEGKDADGKPLTYLIWLSLTYDAKQCPDIKKKAVWEHIYHWANQTDSLGIKIEHPGDIDLTIDYVGKALYESLLNNDSETLGSLREDTASIDAPLFVGDYLDGFGRLNENADKIYAQVLKVKPYNSGKWPYNDPVFNRFFRFMDGWTGDVHGE